MNDNIDDKDLKEIDNIEDTSTDIQAKIPDWKDMIFANHDRDGNNANSFHEDMVWYKTTEQTSNLPSQHGFRDETNVGMLVTCRTGWKTAKLHTQSDITATQYFFPGVKNMNTAHTGKIYVRFGFNVGKATQQRPGVFINEQTHWGTWQEIKGAKGDKGDNGLNGAEGPQGAMGEGVRLQGVVDSREALDRLLNSARQGDCYVLHQGSASNLFVKNNGQWIDLGNFKGIAGPQGPRGPQGTTADLTNYYKHDNDTLRGDINNYKGLGSRKTENIRGIPNGHGDGFGTIIYVPENYNNGNNEHKGFQLYNSTSHKVMYYRSSDRDGNWQSWNRIVTDDIGLVNSLLRKLTSNNDNLNNLGDKDFNALITSNNVQNIPQNASDKGYVEHRYYGIDRQYQKYVDLTNRKTYERYKHNLGTDDWEEWKEIAFKDDIPQVDVTDRFNHPKDTVQNADSLLQNGYTHTTTTTTGLPDSKIMSDDSKEGILKAVKYDNDGQEYIIQTYRPIKGKNAGHTFERTLRVNSPYNDIEDIVRNWKNKSQPSVLQIHVDARGSNITPEQYAHSGSTDLVIFESKWYTILDLPGDNIDHGICLLQTTIMGTGQPRGDSREEYEIIQQLVHTEKTNKIFVRSVSKKTGEPTWPQWSKSQWIDLTANKESTELQEEKIKAFLIKMFKEWTQSHTI